MTAIIIPRLGQLSQALWPQSCILTYK